MWVKICANTNLEDAALAAKLGADAVGFIFAPSGRRMTAAQVAAITSHLPAGIEKVGVFGAGSENPTAGEIVQTATEAGLTTVQIHGGLDEALLNRLTEEFAGRVEIIQTLHWVVGDAGSADRLMEQLARVARIGGIDRVLIDSKVSKAGGGTGVTFDWDAAREVFAAAPEGIRLILAGGLRAENVSEAIGRLKPFGVDVASGVEAEVGRKDPARLAQFIENARGAETP